MGKNVALADRLKTLRKARGWTQHDLSRASGLTRSHISRLERGDIQLPSSERLRQLAVALGTSLDDLLEAAGYRDPVTGDGDLPDLAIYLRHKYGLDDPRLVDAVSTLLTCVSQAAARSQE
jgi:transcriptional regulator with XRE-family HTH domain